MQQASKPQGLARNGTNFETKCGCVPLIYGKPCGSDKRIRVRKHCRLTAKFNIHSILMLIGGGNGLPLLLDNA